MNPLSDKFNNIKNSNIPLNNNNNGMNLLQLIGQFSNFAKNFKGDPNQEILNMLNNGSITKEQFNQVVNKAKEIQQLLNLK